MSNQGYSEGGQQDGQNLPTTNPWAEEHSQQQQQQSQYQPYQQPLQPQQQNPQHGYSSPPGPPPQQREGFNEEQFVPSEERGEQREAMENFEMNRTKPESQTDRDVATLQEEFPAVDGSLIAALYSDSQSLSGTREMLQELATQS
ncbi:hypothetical protein DOTSEDRAFT_67797 [Dothistroma septosporum NZE10]|uniref:CUE domain-containing protein n=1 Tax=Dothistroma septosporum (strain NZE10 / CBS 128990) TaxID=675120 RepID=N1Q2Z7_DOTSN|nr:hypothetical protein DOTSEDRAFT_67797 [Dothistroma septosporum NZE10]